MQRDWQTLSADLAPTHPLVDQRCTTCDELHTWDQRGAYVQSCDIAVATQRTLVHTRTLAARLGISLD
jgi:hypothetical protein